MSRRELIRDVFDELGNCFDRFSRRAPAPGRGDIWLPRACGKIIGEAISFAGALDRHDMTPDDLRRIGEAAAETFPDAFRQFGATLAARLFDDRAK
jgi:hypothetical protein